MLCFLVSSSICVMNFQNGVFLWMRELCSPCSHTSRGGHPVAPVAQPRWPAHPLLGEKQLSLFLADTKFPILGADFLRHHCLVVDLAAGRLNNTDTLQQLGSAVSSPGAGGLLASVQATPSPFRSLFSEF
jgi:hypothetical protein